MMMAVDLDSPQTKYLKLFVPLYIEPSMIMKQTFSKRIVVQLIASPTERMRVSVPILLLLLSIFALTVSAYGKGKQRRRLHQYKKQQRPRRVKVVEVEKPSPGGSGVLSNFFGSARTPVSHLSNEGSSLSGLVNNLLGSRFFGNGVRMTKQFVKLAEALADDDA